jgi:hypothetical protein
MRTLIFVLAILALSGALQGCGAHISSDPVIVKHQIDLEQLTEYCQLYVCDNDAACTHACVQDLIQSIGEIGR